MVFGYYGSYYSLATLRELAKTTQEGTTAFGLVKVAEGEGFETRAIRADMTLFDEDIIYPFIAHVVKNGTLMHYYVVVGCDKKTIHIADPDPSVKMIKMPRERFEKECTGVSIFIAPTPSYKVHKEQKDSLLSFLPILSRQKGLILNIVVATLLVTLHLLLMVMAGLLTIALVLVFSKIPMNPNAPDPLEHYQNPMEVNEYEEI